MRKLGLYFAALCIVVSALLASMPRSHVKADDDDRVTYTTIDFPGAISTGAFAIVRLNPNGDIVGS